MLVPTFQTLLAEAGIAAKDLKAIAVGIGPGSYTGLRVGVMAAKTLAYATGAHLVALDSLEFFARSAPILGGSLRILIDAQRGDFHVADYERIDRDAPLRKLGPTRLISGELLSTSSPTPETIGGPGVTAWKHAWPSGSTILTGDEAAPYELLAMAHAAIAEGRFSDAHSLEPGYFRESAAEDLWRARDLTSPRPPSGSPLP